MRRKQKIEENPRNSKVDLRNSKVNNGDRDFQKINSIIARGKGKQTGSGNMLNSETMGLEWKERREECGDMLT